MYNYINLCQLDIDTTLYYFVQAGLLYTLWLLLRASSTTVLFLSHISYVELIEAE